MNKQQLVDEFMRLAGQYTGGAKPFVPSIPSRRLRIKLIAEELSELATASGLCMDMIIYGDSHTNKLTEITNLEQLAMSNSVPSVIDVADAIADLLYVVYGTAVAWGIDIDPVFKAVHEANMRKFGPGGYEREDGKWMKPPDWEAPDIAGVLKSQGWKA